MENISILTRCSRTKNLLDIKESITTNQLFNITWYILFDISSISEIDTSILYKLKTSNIKVEFIFGKSVDGSLGINLVNDVIDKLPNSEWVYILDDDNILHENFYSRINEVVNENKNILGIIFSQKVDGKDFTGLDIRQSNPDSVKPKQIDIAQYLLKKEIVGNVRYEMSYITDGVFIENIYNSNKDKFIFIDDVLSYYNYLNSKTIIPVPKILVLGEENVILDSQQHVSYESSELNVLSIKTDTNINEILHNFNPDSIISIGNDYTHFSNMFNQSLDYRLRWMHFEKMDPKIGKIAYECAMNYILNGKSESEPLISFFTPFFNTGDKLKRTFDSITSQIYTNWEWVLVNDSNDSKTLNIAYELAKKDPRVKVYDFREKSGGVIGEAKYRAASLCKGKYLMELDHDDCLTEDAGLLMVKAFKEYPDCKFVYSDCVEIDELGHSMTYGDGFCFGYGSYRKEIYKENIYDVANTSNINPKTIRHIVGVPNHFRAWERDFYFSIGGHNRRLSIADDYELIVRSFLKTKFVRIPKICYFQYYYNSNTLNNTQNLSRADIQRRVRTISQYYNDKIKNRFNELGFTDWAYDENSSEPLNVSSRFGDSEGYVNYTMNLNPVKVEDEFEYII